jgi:hypothetical protein
MRGFMALILTVAASASGGEPELRAKPTALVEFAQKPKGVSPRVLPFGFGFKQGFDVHFLVEGNNFVGFNRGSFKVHQIVTEDGTELIAAAGPKVAKLGSHLQIDEDKKSASFWVEVDSNEFQRADGIKMTGEITIFTGTKKATATGMLEAKDDATAEIGPFRIKRFEKLSLPGQTRNKSAGITIVGSREAVSEMSLQIDGKTVRTTSVGEVADSPNSTYFFGQGDQVAVEVTIKYWEDLARRKVIFEKDGIATKAER